jgi:hypothetical protein
MNTRVLLLLGCLFALSGQAQDARREMWVWKDANGVTHYSDRPVPGARKLEIAGVTSPNPSPAVATPGQPAAKPGQPAAIEYRSLEIWQPENGASFFGADATVDVRMRSDPEVAATHRLMLYLDGKLVEGAGNALEHNLSNLERGVHSLTAVILDEQGNEKIRSEPRVFHVRQPSTIAPRAVGPNLKPPPKTGS